MDVSQAERYRYHLHGRWLTLSKLNPPSTCAHKMQRSTPHVRGPVTSIFPILRFREINVLHVDIMDTSHANESGVLRLPKEQLDLILGYIYPPVSPMKAVDDCQRRQRAYNNRHLVDARVYHMLPEASLLLTCRQLRAYLCQYYEDLVSQSWSANNETLAVADLPQSPTSWYCFAIELRYTAVLRATRFYLRTYQVARTGQQRVYLTTTLLRQRMNNRWEPDEHGVFSIDMNLPEIDENICSVGCNHLAAYSEAESKELYAGVMSEALEQLSDAAAAGAQSARLRYEPLKRIWKCLKGRPSGPLRQMYYWKPRDMYRLAYGNRLEDVSY